MIKNKSCLHCGKKLTGLQSKYCCRSHCDMHYISIPKHHKAKVDNDKLRYLRKKPEMMEDSREYYKENKEQVKERCRKYTMNRYHSDENFRMRVKLGTSLNYVIRHYLKTGRVMNPMAKYCIDWEGIVKQLKPFPKNRKDYHADHIIPLCKFDLTDWNQIQLAFAPENHQWLKVKDNLIKGGRDKNFSRKE